MKVLRIIGYIFGVLVLLLVGVIGVATYLDMTDPNRPHPNLMQTLTVGGKTVHLLRGDKDVGYKTSMDGNGITINDKKIDLSDGSVFTVVIYSDGRLETRKGAP